MQEADLKIFFFIMALYFYRTGYMYIWEGFLLSFVQESKFLYLAVCFHALQSLYEKGSTCKGKNLLPLGKQVLSV